MSAPIHTSAPRRHSQWRTLLQGQRLPTALIDIEAVDQNADLLLARLGSGPVTLRLASKSIRVPWLIRHILNRSDRFAGLMTFSAYETEFLFGQGFDDFLLAYPVSRAVDAQALARVAKAGGALLAVVDSAAHVQILAAAARQLDTEISLALDIDMSLSLMGGRVHLGVRRSPIQGPKDALALAALIAQTEGVTLKAVQAYEAQLAGVQDRSTGASAALKGQAVRLIKARSRPMVLKRRAAIVQALRQAGHDLVCINGGGTGSVAFTSGDPSVTEVAAGSGFLCPHSFDGYNDLALTPAAFFAIAVNRIPAPDMVTCGGGGFPASGPAGVDRSPVIHSPSGLAPLGMEGYGEVQTPLQGPAAHTLKLGDPIICRHAKAGELAERFNEVLIIRGNEIIDRQPTYRGLGGCF